MTDLSNDQRAGHNMPARRAVSHQVAMAGHLPTTAVVIPVHGLGGRISAPRAHIFHGLGDHLCSCRRRIDYSLIVGKIKSLKGKASPQIRIKVPFKEEKHLNIYPLFANTTAFLLVSLKGQAYPKDAENLKQRWKGSAHHPSFLPFLHLTMC